MGSSDAPPERPVGATLGHPRRHGERLAQGDAKTGARWADHVNSTPHRAHITRATHAIFLVCTWLKMIEFSCSLVCRKCHSISSMFGGTLLDALFSLPFSTPFPTLAPGPTTSPSLLHPSASPSTATLQGGYV